MNSSNNKATQTRFQIDALFRKGIAFHQSGQLSQAWEAYRHVLQLQANHFDALHMAGLVAAQANQNELALQLLGNAIAVNPNSADAYGNRGNVFIQMERFQDALDCFNKVNQIRPGQAETYSNRGNALKGLKQFELALESYDKAIQLNPNLATAHANRGAVLIDLKRYLAALDDLKAALKIQPHLATAHVNCGVVWMQLMQYQTAIGAFNQALPLLSNKTEALLPRGISLAKIGHHQEAIADFEKVIELNPNHDSAYAHLGTSLYELRRFQQSYESYVKAYSLKPEIPFLYGMLIRTKLFMCNWSGFESDYAELCQKLTDREKVATPLIVAGLIDSPSLQQNAAQVFIEHEHPVCKELGEIEEKKNSEKISIGYYSSDFRNHPVAYLTAELFELHNREKFTITAFSLGPNSKDEIQERISKAVDHFIDVHALSDREIVELSRKMGIDIAVDLNGLTQGARTNIFSLRVAPIQLGYIGYLGTTGAEYMDYIVADKTIIPDDARSFYTEKIIYLPSYQVNDSKSRSYQEKISRQELGIPEDAFVFCCFNSNYKITPPVFDGWMRILSACENSVLLVSADSLDAESNLRREASARGVDCNRLIFCKRLKRSLYLARFQVADLFLDTWPYNAGATASDALWVGLPIITLAGQSFASRIAASLLTAIDLPELITNTLDQYVSLAIELAANKDKLEAVRSKLLENKHKTKLFNTPSFTSFIEAAFLKAIQRYEAGLSPDHIYID